MLPCRALVTVKSRIHSEMVDFGLGYYLRSSTRQVRGMENLSMAGDSEILVCVV